MCLRITSSINIWSCITNSPVSYQKVRRQAQVNSRIKTFSKWLSCWTWYIPTKIWVEDHDAAIIDCPPYFNCRNQHWELTGVIGLPNTFWKYRCDQNTIQAAILPWLQKMGQSITPPRINTVCYIKWNTNGEILATNIAYHHNEMKRININI